MRKIPLKIQTARLCLRKLVPEDSEPLLRWLKSLSASPMGVFDPALPESFPLETFVFDPGGTFSLQYAITILGTSKLIGLAGLYHIDGRKGVAEVGIVIGDPAYRGQGLGPETIRRLADIAGKELGLTTLFARVRPRNTRAEKCFEKVGFVTDGTGVWSVQVGA